MGAESIYFQIWKGREEEWERVRHVLWFSVSRWGVLQVPSHLLEKRMACEWVVERSGNSLSLTSTKAWKKAKKKKKGRDKRCFWCTLSHFLQRIVLGFLFHGVVFKVPGHGAFVLGRILFRRSCHMVILSSTWKVSCEFTKQQYF